MSVASYLFVATADDAQRNDGLVDGPDEYRAEFYRVMDINLRPLYRILTGKECPQFEPAVMNEDCSLITFRFPAELTAALATLTEGRRETIVSMWQDDESVPYDNDADLFDLVAALERLAKKAHSTGLSLYLWNCL